MTDNTQGSKQGFVGKLTAQEVAADQKANADQPTRPSITVERALRDLRATEGRGTTQ